MTHRGELSSPREDEKWAPVLWYSSFEVSDRREIPREKQIIYYIADTCREKSSERHGRRRRRSITVGFRRIDQSTTRQSAAVTGRPDDMTRERRKRWRRVDAWDFLTVRTHLSASLKLRTRRTGSWMFPQLLNVGFRQ